MFLAGNTPLLNSKCLVSPQSHYSSVCYSNASSTGCANCILEFHSTISHKLRNVEKSSYIELKAIALGLESLETIKWYTDNQGVSRIVEVGKICSVLCYVFSLCACFATLSWKLSGLQDLPMIEPVFLVQSLTIHASGVLDFLLDRTALWVGGLRKVGINLQLRHIGLHRVELHRITCAGINKKNQIKGILKVSYCFITFWQRHSNNFRLQSVVNLRCYEYDFCLFYTYFFCCNVG